MKLMIKKKLPRLLEKYHKEVIPEMKKIFGYKNDLAVPKILKVVINTGIGKFLKDEKTLKDIERDLALISGQKPSPTAAKKSISSFKIREGMIVGYKVTLRKRKMYDFLDKFINIALPRTRDFRGINKDSLDTNGNLAIGIREHIVFPEVISENIKNIFSLEVCITTTAKTRQEALQLFKLLGFPIREK